MVLLLAGFGAGISMVILVVQDRAISRAEEWLAQNPGADSVLREWLAEWGPLAAIGLIFVVFIIVMGAIIWWLRCPFPTADQRGGTTPVSPRAHQPSPPTTPSVRRPAVHRLRLKGDLVESRRRSDFIEIDVTFEPSGPMVLENLGLILGSRHVPVEELPLRELEDLTIHRVRFKEPTRSPSNIFSSSSMRTARIWAMADGTEWESDEMTWMHIGP